MGKIRAYRAISNDDKTIDSSPLSLELKDITGFYANQYINPVRSKDGEIIKIISDESIFKNHYGVALVAMPFIDSNKLSKQMHENLELLLLKYNIKNIHFTDIFGKNKVIRRREEEFIYDYSDIVKDLPMTILSLSFSKDKITKDSANTKLTNEEIFFTLFWNNFERLIKGCKNNSVIHIFMEQENSVNEKNAEELVRNIFMKLYSGIDQVYKKVPNKYISVCKNPHWYTKGLLIYSSIADLGAYATNKIQQKIDKGISDKKIISEYRLLLKAIKLIFNNYSGLPSERFVNILSSINA
jgi:hypothetical protein